MPEKSLLFNDWLLLVRLLAAVGWGFLFAAILQHTKKGQYWVEERTWMTVAIGFVVDWFLAFGGDLYTWLMIGGIFAFSAIGIINRSEGNYRKKARKNGRNPVHYNNMVNSLDEAVTMTMRLNDTVLALLRDSQELRREDVLTIKEIIATSTELQRKVVEARKGEYHPIKEGRKK